MKILIQNGRVVDPASGRDEIADVAIAASPRLRSSFIHFPADVAKASQASPTFRS